jgi:transposase
MPFESQRPKIKLTAKEHEVLTAISKSRTEAKSRVERAQMILAYTNYESINSIAKKLNTNRPRVERTIDRATGFGVLTALNDLPRKGTTPKITKEARVWFLSIACTKPKDLGFASELWTYESLAKYIRDHCHDAGHPSLEKIGKGTVSKILSKSDVKPHKIAYYLEKKDADFDIKMTQILHVYKEVELYKAKDDSEHMMAILSYDEKPGIQAIENIAPDLAPRPKIHPNWGRDYEYKRHGTVSLLASIDLLNGKIFGQIHDRHRSKEFVGFLKGLDESYPPDFKIKIILDNHSSHISKETKAYLKTVPNRFEFIFTPTHASWLNIIEVFFSKMTRTFLRGLRVESKAELKERILKYLDEVNEMPTIFKWKWKMEDIIVG